MNNPVLTALFVGAILIIIEKRVLYQLRMVKVLSRREKYHPPRSIRWYPAKILIYLAMIAVGILATAHSISATLGTIVASSCVLAVIYMDVRDELRFSKRRGEHDDRLLEHRRSGCCQTALPD